MNRAVSQRSHVVSGFVLAVALGLPTVVLAQDAPASTEGPATAPPPDANAQPAPPPGHYPPPPPRASGQAQAPAGGYQYPQQYPPQNPPSYQYPGYPPPPPNYYPPPRVRRGYYEYPQTNGVYRPISISLGIGPGLIRGPSKYSDVNGAGKAALSYNLFRLGFGIAPNWQLIIAYEGTGTSTTTPDDFKEDSWLSQNNWLLGLQYYITRQLYIRGAAGLGSTSESSATLYTSTRDGIAVSGGLGFELVQSRHAALGLDLSGSITSYASEHWETGGLNLAVTFF